MTCALLIGMLVIGQGPPAAPATLDAALLDAAAHTQVDRARELIARGADVNATDQRGLTPLMWASANGHAALAEDLLRRGARPDARAASGDTALRLAAANGFLDIVRLLLARGADPGARDAAETPGTVAAARGHAEIAALLEQAATLGAALVQAVSEGQNALARQLLARGAPFNARNSDGASALMLAARSGDLGTIQFLLARGADPLLRDKQGSTMFDWAQRSPTTAPYVTAFLHDRGVTPDAPVATSVTAGAPPVKDSLAALERLLAGLRPRSDAVRRAHGRATQAVGQLVALSRSWPDASPEDYRVNLAREVRVLETAVSAEGQTLAQALQSVADDLETKLEHCRRTGGKLGGSVRVRVRTLQDGQEIRSWRVFYMPKILEVSDTATPDLFPQLSSPTEELLVPGRYVMWARQPGSDTAGARIVVKVGEGRPELLVDLPVPPAGSR